MPRTFSLAEAQESLEDVVAEAARGEPVPLAREGKVIAYVVRAESEDKSKKEDFLTFLHRFRATHDLHLLDAERAFDDVRDRGPGREVEL